MKLVLRLLVAAGLLVDAYVHLHLASQYDAVKTSSLSQGDLFRVEGVAALLAAVAVLVFRRWITDLAAFAVAAGGAVAVLLTRYVDVGGFGPVPSMYEPIWYTEKTVSLVAEVVAAVAALVLVVAGRRAPTASSARATSGARSLT